MVHLRHATVTAMGHRRPGAQECRVEIDGASALAIVYPDLVGDVSVGDQVLVNTTAVDLDLGTGGFHVVVAIEGAQGPDRELPGRIVKARYLPHQTAVASVEETHREVLEASPGLRGTPVVVAPLHSMLGPIAAGARVAGAERIAYVMTDAAALPAAFSRTVPTLREAGLLDGTVSSGQAFGAELEAVTIWTGLLAAREILDADVIVVADGPGSLGTDTRWGAGALQGGHALNAAETLGGRPVAALRISFADLRERHRGVSHHSLTMLSGVALVESNVAVPTLEGEQRDAVWGALRAAELERRHRLVEVLGEPALDALTDRGIEVTSMGRGVAEDRAFFLAAGAAGILAGRMAVRSRAYRPI